MGILHTWMNRIDRMGFTSPSNLRLSVNFAPIFWLKKVPSQEPNSSHPVYPVNLKCTENVGHNILCWLVDLLTSIQEKMWSLVVEERSKNDITKSDLVYVSLVLDEELSKLEPNKVNFSRLKIDSKSSVGFIRAMKPHCENILREYDRRELLEQRRKERDKR